MSVTTKPQSRRPETIQEEPNNASRYTVESQREDEEAQGSVEPGTLAYPYPPMHPPFTVMPNVDMIPHLAGMDPLQAHVFVVEVNRAVSGGIAPLAAIGMGLAMSFSQFYPTASAIFVQNWQAAVAEAYGPEETSKPQAPRELSSEPTINVHIAGLKPSFNDAALRELCLPFSGFRYARVIRNTARNHCKGYGFAHFLDIPSAESFMRAVNLRGYRASFARVQASDAKRAEPFSAVSISRLPHTWQENDLKAELANVEPIGLRIVRDPSSGKSKGFAIARFESRARAEVALVQLQMRIFDPKQGPSRVRLSQEWVPLMNKAQHSYKGKENIDPIVRPGPTLREDENHDYLNHYRPKEPSQTVQWHPANTTAIESPDYARAVPSGERPSRK